MFKDRTLQLMDGLILDDFDGLSNDCSALFTAFPCVGLGRIGKGTP